MKDGELSNLISNACTGFQLSLQQQLIINAFFWYKRSVEMLLCNIQYTQRLFNEFAVRWSKTVPPGFCTFTVFKITDFSIYVWISVQLSINSDSFWTRLHQCEGIFTSYDNNQRAWKTKSDKMTFCDDWYGNHKMVSTLIATMRSALWPVCIM